MLWHSCSGCSAAACQGSVGNNKLKLRQMDTTSVVLMENCGNWMVRYSKLLTSSDPLQLIFYLTHILTFYLAFCLVRQCPLRSGARGWGGGGRRKAEGGRQKAEGRRRKAEGGGRRDAPVIKSRDPHLAGGEWKTTIGPPHSKSPYPKTPTYHLFPTFLVVIFPFSLLETCYDCYIPILAIPSP